MSSLNPLKSQFPDTVAFRTFVLAFISKELLHLRKVEFKFNLGEILVSQ